MPRTIIAFAACIALSAATASADDWAAKMFKTSEHDFGTVARGAKAEFDFRLTNLYRDDVHIATVYSSCGCTSVSVIRPTLKSWEEGAIHAVFNTPSFLGSRSATITVVIDKPMQAEVLLHVRGVIRGDVVFEPSSVQFGDVAQGKAVEKNIRISRNGWGDWNITGVKSSNPHLSAKVLSSINQNGWSVVDLAVKLDKSAPVGYLQDHLLLLANEGQTVEMPLEIEGRVISRLTVSPSTLFFGAVQPGQAVTRSLVVKGDRPFKVLSVTCDDKSFEFPSAANDKASAVHIIPVNFVAGPNEGKIARSIKITTDLGEVSPDVSAHAVIERPTVANDK